MAEDSLARAGLHESKCGNAFGFVLEFGEEVGVKCIGEAIPSCFREIATYFFSNYHKVDLQR